MTADSQSPSKGEPKDAVVPSQVTDSGPEATPTEDKTTDTQEENQPSSEPEGDDEKSKEEEVLPVGSVTASHNLFAKYDKDGKRSWSATMPTHIEEAAENDETKKFAVIVRKLAPKEADSSKPLIVDSIIIQSPHLKTELGKLFKDYPGIVIDVTRLVLHAPFAPFVHCWDEFVAATEHAKGELAKEHLTLLRDILEEELKETLQAREDFIKTRAVDWAHVWTLFKPGCLVWGSKNGQPAAFKFTRGEYGENNCGKFFGLHCKHIDWDGKTLGWTNAVQKIYEYPGSVPLTDMSCFPLEMHPQLEQATASLYARGKGFESLAGYNYKFYKGMALWWDSDTQKIRQEVVDSRIVIDAVNWANQVPDLSFTTSKALGNDGCCNRNNDSDDESENGDGDENDEDESDEESEGSYSDVGAEFNDKTESKKKQKPTLSDDKLILTSPMVRGYSLKNRRWMEFFIHDISEIKFAENAFESLVLDQDKKDLILAFAQSQTQFKSKFDDVVSGKGRGIVMLLAGGPGIGKTLTAETVAEEMRVPLYSMSANDLGESSWRMEWNLKRILSMVSAWNAVLLLDECDVYLEARSSHDVHRNSIVSVFLRMLEYYEGILFMTTNRVQTIDTAFKSRIHLTLQYPNLDATAREKVWRTFLDRSVGQDKLIQEDKDHRVTDEDIRTLGKLDINGREIKNILKMANLLAWQKKEPLNMAHLEKVLKIQDAM
ncbi:unnamed protein product [Clonostachys rosea f. rosea IK726]|uniref:AAA+ ATPase domain-containing protein n=2 Tax=Bionectria ochroleuca TaxID=29856 RepID=A0A0B7K9N4_BIOOC|nr:unnamed protein product [Clonostachys rosea f. rosea IK726]